MTTPFDPQPCCGTGVVPGITDVNIVGPDPLVVSVGGSLAPEPTLTAATTGNGTFVTFGDAKSNVTLFVQPMGTVTGGVVDLEASHDGTNWVVIASSAALATGVNQYIALSGGAFLWFRGTVSEDVTGGGSVTATLMYA